MVIEEAGNLVSIHFPSRLKYLPFIDIRHRTVAFVFDILYIYIRAPYYRKEKTIVLTYVGNHYRVCRILVDMKPATLMIFK